MNLLSRRVRGVRLGSLPTVAAGSGVAGWLLLSVLYAAPAGAAGTGVDLGGTAVAGSTDPAHPTPVAAGLWRDELGSTSSGADTHVFRYHRTMADSTVHVGVVARPGGGDSSSSGIGLKVTTGDTDCESSSGSSGYDDPAVFGTSVSVGDGDESDTCSTAADLTIAVDHGYDSDDGEIPFALKVVEEAPVRDADQLPAPAESDSGAPTPDADVADRPGRPSFPAAPELDASDGVTVSTSVTEGEQQLWRVPVTWGQQVGATVEVPKMDAAADKATDGLGPTVAVHLISPMREDVGTAPSGSSTSKDYSDEAGKAVVVAGPLLYRNRESSDPLTVPGDVWVLVSVEAADDRDPISVPLHLTVAVTGTAGRAPSYFPTVQAPDRSAGPDGYSPKTPFLRHGDRVRIEMTDDAGQTIFGAIDQTVAGLQR